MLCTSYLERPRGGNKANANVNIFSYSLEFTIDTTTVSTERERENSLPSPHSNSPILRIIISQYLSTLFIASKEAIVGYSCVVPTHVWSVFLLNPRTIIVIHISPMLVAHSYDVNKLHYFIKFKKKIKLYLLHQYNVNLKNFVLSQ